MVLASDRELKSMDKFDLNIYWNNLEDYRTSEEFTTLFARKLREHSDKVFKLLRDKL